MKQLALTLFTRFALFALSLRYRIEFRGEEALKQLKKGEGILFLSSHPSEIEPLFLALRYWPAFRFRPIAVEYAFRIPFLRPLLKWMGAIPIPRVSFSVNEIKAKAAEQAIQIASETLRSGGAIFLYPGGGVKKSSSEILGGASGTHTLLASSPKVHVVLIRVRGLWGSSFSQALIGSAPHVTDVCFSGIKALFKNGIFFMPRRKVVVEIELDPADFPRNGSRLELNRYLENWYNAKPDPLSLVPYQFWSRKIAAPYVPEKKAISGGGSIVEETWGKITEEIRRILGDARREVTLEMSLTQDLGLDSLDLADLSAYVTKNFEVESLRPEEMALFQAEATVKDLCRLAQGALLSIHLPGGDPVPSWPEEAKEKKRPAPQAPQGATIPEAFLSICRRMGSFAACMDAVSGPLSYAQLKRRVFVLASYFQTLPEERVAVMLPASVGAFAVILALQCAGKVPVMLNWTLGPRYLEEMLRLSGASEVITSHRFIDRVSQVDFGTLTGKMRHLETIRSQLSLKMKGKGIFFRPKPLDPESPCVLLFTSGSEIAPKCVPLSHTNLLSNAAASFEALGTLTSKDANYSVLPPFHSFGFNCAGLFPLLAGIQTTFSPDPTDGSGIAEGIYRSKSTLFAGPPSFIQRVFNAGSPEQLQSVRLYVSAAEKAPRELIEQAEKLGAQFLEGYGATECSPVVSMNRPNLPKKGVGKLLSGFELIAIQPETGELLPTGAEGEICLRGASVFHGYLGSNKVPFIELEGKRWYRTGDLGKIDAEGYLILSGRLKRFVKMGGEMISLGAIEEILTERLLKEELIPPHVPSVAVSAKEQKIVLFSTVPLEKEKANEMLKKGGLSNLIKISAVQQVGEIPIMGTGKVDYRKLGMNQSSETKN